MSPKSTVPGLNMNFVQMYKKEWGVVIYEMNQPILKGTCQGKTTYLVPECV